MNIKNLFTKFKKTGKRTKIIALIIVLVVVGFLIFTNYNSSKNKVQYQTAQVQKGTLVVSLTEAGQVSVTNRVSVVTQASGVIKNIYVKSGDKVNAGDKIADIALDTAGQQRQAQAWSSYLSSQNSLKNAQVQLYSLQNALFVANQKFVNDKGIANPTEENKQDPVYIEENASWLAAEAAYKNQEGVINQAQAALNNASLSYQLASGTITAPVSGTIEDLTITKGIQIGSQNTTAGSSTNTSNQSIASISTGDSTTVTVNIAEVDVPKIKVDQTATVTFDALSDKTFTGKIMGINTTGSVSSGVTTYPAVIQLDNTSKDVFSNMSATANIITKVEDNVLLVPSSAVQTISGTSTVKVLKNGKVSTIDVEIGDSSDSQTVIKSGLSEGETVVTSSTSTTTQSTTTSPFGGGLRIGNFGGGGTTGETVRRTTGN